MIEELKISNFRVFDDEVTIRFRPITILIGRNNSGKTSIIKFLLLLQQSLSPDNDQFLSPEGERVQFGNLQALKNTMSGKSELIFQLTATENLSSIRGGLRSYLDGHNIDERKLRYLTNATISYDGQLKEHEVTLSHDGENLLTKEKYLDKDSAPLLDFTEEFASEEGKPESEKEDQEKAVRTRSAERVLIGVLRENIRDIYYLSSIRSGTERVIKSEEKPSMKVGQRGEYTLPLLQDIMDTKKILFNFMLPHIEAVADIAGIEFDRNALFDTCYGINKTTGAKVFIDAFGFGTRQCLPIFVQGAIMPAYTSLMIEEPEANLHPTAQLALGSFFADLWNKHSVGSIIETHSGNILLRLRRLIAKGDLNPEHVSVAFFEVEDKKPSIRNLTIEDDGEIEEGLPMEFFGGDIMEYFDIREEK